MKRSFLIIVSLILLAVAWFGRGIFRDVYDQITREPLPTPQTASPERNVNISQTTENTNTEEPPTTNRAEPTNSSETNPLPTEVNLAVPFTSQAPHANWDLPYQEACEEAAALMVHRFWQNQTFSSKEDADAAIRAIVDFEEQQYGDYKDTTAKETAQFIKDLWGYESIDVFEGSAVTLDRIKHEVAEGYPVIVLAAGRQLGNPNFRSPGPIYHALVVKGYTKKGQLITNDPGTRKGADYLYDPAVLFEAIHDWNDGDVEKGQKAMVVVRGQ